MKRIVPLAALAAAAVLLVPTSRADEPKEQIGVAYGKHERQVLDFYPAKSDKPTPVVIHIHGGGWRGGDKKTNPKQFLDKGISVVAINYRFVQHGVEDKVEPPVKAPLHDAARALQFVRSKAKEWNLDKTKIGATGGSAGACTSLWLAFHDDMAQKDSKDPIARESTRLTCAAVNGAQTSLDPKQVREWMPNYTYGAHAFGMKNLDEVEKNRDTLAKWIKEYSPIEHVSKDDPPIGLFYGADTEPVEKDKKEKDKKAKGKVIETKFGIKPADPTHSPVLGLGLEKKLKEVGVEYVLVYPGHTSDKYKTSADFLIAHLTK